VTAAAYGSVLVLAAIAAIGLDDVGAEDGWELVIGVGAATWLAHAYAEVIGEHMHSSARVSRQEVIQAMADGSPILLSAVVPTFVLSFAKAGVLDAVPAVTVAVAVAIAQLVGIGVYAGSGVSRRRGGRWIYATETAVIGVAVVTLKLIIAH
jgi:hypothetical protein